MTGQNEFRVSQQSCQCRIFFFVHAVFEEVFMFFFANVSTYATEFACFQSISQSFGINQTTTSNVDEDYAVFHFSDSFCVDHVFCSGHQRAVDGDNVGLSIQFIQCYVFQTQVGVGECIVSQDFHAVAFQDVDHALTDFTCTDNTCCFACQSDTCQTSDVEVEFCCSIPAQVCVSVDCHQQSSTLFSNGFGRVSGYTQNGQTSFFRCSQVYGVETCTSQQQNFDTQVFQCFNNFCGQFVVNERACSIVTCSQVSCCGCQSFIEECDFIAVFFCHGFETVNPVRFCVEKCNFHWYLPPKK